MKLKIALAKSPSHSAAVTCVGWSSTEEVYSIGDDNQLLSWSVSNNQSKKVAQLGKDLFAIDMQFLPRTSGTLSKHGDLILVTSADGKFHIMNRSGRIERSVEAHKGAILVGQWGNDGAGLLTAGEDGCIKIWSRSGMLRSIVVSSDNSVYGASWAPDSQSIAYTQGKFIVIKQLAPNTKPLRWKAHEELVLCLAWSPASELIVSGGEDCQYKVWDGQGRQLFYSGPHDNHITSIAWAPNGDLFAVGSYNTVRLCDYSGWSRSLEKPTTGCVYKMAWSGDGTQLAGACANGHVFFAHIVERHVHYKNFTASVTERKVVTVRNVVDDTFEQLELPERVIQLALKYTHLVATTPTQCYIYSTNNWNTPAIFDLKDGSVILLLLAEKHMLLVEKNTIGIYNYQGRLIASPRWPNMRLDSLRATHISLSSDTLVVRDSIDHKIVHVIDLSSVRSTTESTSTVQHFLPILQVALDQWGPPSARMLALVNKTKDLYVVAPRSNNKIFHKLGRKTESFQWNSEANIIATIQDAQLVVWYCPTAAFNSTLLKLCSMQYGAPELGRNPRISDFVGNSVSIRRADGSLINVPISPFPSILHRCIQDNKWSDALNLCRSTNDETLWACLAVLTTQSSADVIDIAEEAFANINHFDKVFYIQYAKSLTNKIQQKAAIALLGGAQQEAEAILLHNGMVFQAIYSNIQMHNWRRALDLAIKHKTHIDTVLFLRQKYLDSLGKPESDNKFSSMNETIQIDAEKVQQKISAELQK
ncbi:intraflagellar transport protein 80 homolog [Tribolium castaneum]|uniref:Intraflagellar transport protein 80 homolog-like Protein n=1 Tax=Tribolium castaneum TaxID=7070 RepID=D6WLD8_TRICA|nr:PREDICTED: intraflagellar transport protein 80 homolog [Tribolium castaneum]EFA04099.2 Intraflagellar transport protein 80 homolog-like Protein [Tribolium castaneum]|eukprot:XP_008193745.1 PREDICTED: intraflagellar transport protein 80 homolog [Tribolium castaneum]